MVEAEGAALALLGVALAAVFAYVAYVFVAPLTVAVFVYYATRPVHRRLAELPLDIPAGVRAAVSLLFIGVPLVLLIGYTLVLVVVEAQALAEEYSVLRTLADGVGTYLSSGNPENATQTPSPGAVDAYLSPFEIPDPTFESVFDAYRSGELDAAVSFFVDNLAALAGFVTGFLFNLLVVLVAAYYLLVDGARLRTFLVRYDEAGVVEEYVDAADDELSAVLFGNLLNVLAIGVLAVVVFTAYNAYVPGAVEVPSPALAGALTGVASLVPVVGMKIVYVPLAAVVAATAVLTGGTSLLPYVAGLLVATVVVVDTVPDIVLRPYLSGERTHVGLLMLAYILGPTVFGFYGLFFAPTVLVLALTFADVALPYLLGEDASQKSLDEF